MQIIIDTIKNILPSQCAKSKINFKEIRTSSTMLLSRVNITRIFIDILEKYQVGIVLKKKKKREKKIRGKSLTFMRRKQIMLKTGRGEGVQR